MVIVISVVGCTVTAWIELKLTIVCPPTEGGGNDSPTGRPVGGLGAVAVCMNGVPVANPVPGPVINPAAVGDNTMNDLQTCDTTPVIPHDCAAAAVDITLFGTGNNVPGGELGVLTKAP